MREFFGHCNGLLILLHGGAGIQDPKGESVGTGSTELKEYAVRGFQSLKGGKAPLDVLTECLGYMEDSQTFNAGRGAALQADGQARLTAAVMDGTRQSFSGVISVSYVTHPSLLARHLQDQDARVLTSPGAELLARKLNTPVESQVTNARLKNWVTKFEAGDRGLFDTVGCVIRTPDGRLYAGTSTGGRGFEFPGRVSDSATVAGNYASEFAAISATGTGEEIVDDALSARIETRCRDGATLKDAVMRTIVEAKARQRSYGFIAVSKSGEFAAAHTTPTMTFAVLGDGQILASS